MQYLDFSYGGSYLLARTSAGVNAVQTAGANALLISTTYYIPVFVSESPSVHIHLSWNAALAGTITFETSDFPTGDFPDNSTTGWAQENTASVLTAGGTVTGSGNSLSALTITAGGTTAGTASIHMNQMAAGRLRVKIVTTAAGNLTAASHSKY